MSLRSELFVLNTKALRIESIRVKPRSFLPFIKVNYLAGWGSGYWIKELGVKADHTASGRFSPNPPLPIII